MKRKIFKVVEGAKGGGGDPHVPVEARDSLRSQAKCRMLFALFEGEGAMGLDDTKIFFNKTPLGNADGSRNYEGVRWEVRSGTQHQNPISGFPAVENETAIGLALTQSNPWTKAISNTNIDAVLVRIGIPTMLSQADNGDVNGTFVNFHIDLSVNGGAYYTVGNFRLEGKTTSLYEKTIRVNLPPATSGWQIRVVRTTPDSTSTRLVNGTRIQAITEVIDARFRYPHTALLFVEFDAKMFESIPAISCEPKGRIIQVPENYNPETRVYTGTWNGLFKWAWTDNPAWIWYDALTQKRFGLGQRVTAAMLDKWELYRIAQRCDQLVPDGKGGMGPRFIFNVYLQAQADAWVVIRDIAAGFNGLTFWGNNMFNIISDMPVSQPSQVVTRASVVGQPIYSSGSISTRYSSAVVNYSDANNHYADTPTGYMNQDLQKQFGFKQTTLTAIGCTREEEAQRRGAYAVLTNSIDRILTIKLGLEGFAYLPGTVYAFADERLSGRVMGGLMVDWSAAERKLTLDRDTDGAVGDTIMIRTLGGYVEKRVIQAITGNVLTVASAFTAAPAPNAVFVIDSGQLALQLFRVLNLTFNSDENTFTVESAIYNASKYDAVDEGSRLDTPPVSLLPTGIVSPPTEIKISSYEFVSQGARTTNMRVAWLPSMTAAGQVQPDVVAYEAQWRRGSNDWVNTPASNQTGFDVEGVFAGDYLVRVRAVNSGGASSIWATSTLTHIEGRQGAVPMPLNFRTSPLLFGVQLDWGFGVDAEDSSFTEIQFTESPTGENAVLLTNIPYPAKMYQQTGLKAGAVFYYRARLIDRIGNKSEWTGFIRGESNANADDYLAAIGGDLLTSEDGKALTEKIDFNTQGQLQNALANNSTAALQWAQYGTVNASVLEVKTTQATAEKAFAEYQVQVNTQFGETNAAVAQKMTGIVNATSATAIYTLRTGVMWNGQYYDAGLSIATMADGTGVKSRVAVNADQFVVFNGNTQTAVFAVEGDQAILSSAIIGNATIGFAKIKDDIQSDNYASGAIGWAIRKGGNAEFNNATFRGAMFANSGTMNNVIINENCTILGTLSANKIVGDLAVATNLSGGSATGGTDITRTIYYTGGMAWPMTVCAIATVQGNRSDYFTVSIYVDNVQIAQNSGIGTVALTASASIAAGRTNVPIRIVVTPPSSTGTYSLLNVPVFAFKTASNQFHL